MTELSRNWMQNLEKSASALLSDMMEWALSEVGDRQSYGSEIEVAMAVAMKVLTQVRYQEFGFVPQFGASVADVIGQAGVDCCTVVPEPGRPSLLWGLIFPQVKLLGYRVDFLIVHSHGLDGFGGTVIECDGHDFHDRTKEQAARDRARDRELQQHGYRVLRFTGSEIWKNPFECAEDAIGVAHSVALDSEYARNMIFTGSTARMPQALRHVSKVGRIA